LVSLHLFPIMNSFSQLEGVVLQVTPTGDNHSRLALFTEEHALQSVIIRKSRKSGLSAHPDLFDDLECTLKPPTSAAGLPFVREWNVSSKRFFLAQDHRVFATAAHIARLFLHNGNHLLEPEPLYQLLIKSLHALEPGKTCLVHIKTLFVFAQTEGLPVKQAWLPELSRKARKQAQYILSTKIADFTQVPDEIDIILKSLQDWLNAETELKC